MTKITTASKKALSLLLAMLMLVSVMGISASAADPEYTLDNTNCVLNVAEKSITVTKATVPDGDNTAVVIFAISPSASKIVDESGNTVFYNLQEGKTYTITGSAIVDGKEVIVNKGFNVALKNAQSAPAAPIPEKITATAIEVKTVSGCEYACCEKDAETVWQKSGSFTDLKPETSYVVSIRCKETEDAYASPASSITVKTLKAADPTVPAAPVLEDKSNTSISVKAVEGMEYSKDGGKTWQSSPVFKGLDAKTVYEIIARRKFDASVQEEGPSSSVLEVITNTRASYSAVLSKCEFAVTTEGTYYAEQALAFTVKGDAPTNIGALEYGDTRYRPVSYTATQGSTTTTHNIDATGKCSFTPASKGTLNIVVSYQKEKYIGNDTWEKVGTPETASYSVEIAGKYNAFLAILQGILNTVLNTIPAAINRFLKGDFIQKIITAFFPNK